MEKRNTSVYATVCIYNACVCFGATCPDGIMRRGCHRSGRAARKRRQKQGSSIHAGISKFAAVLLLPENILLLKDDFSITCPSLFVSLVSLCHQLQYVRLMKFLHQRGFTSSLLQPALLTGNVNASVCFSGLFCALFYEVVLLVL